MLFNTQATQYFDANGNLNWIPELLYLIWFVLGINIHYDFKIALKFNNKRNDITHDK